MILSITNLKGGVGKSTIAQNIAVCLRQKGHSVFLVDTDFELKTTTDWGNDRSADLVKIDVECVHQDNVTERVLEVADKYDIVIIDGSPQLSKTATKTLTASDIVLVPITPSSLDVWSFENFLQRYEQVRDVKGTAIKAYIVINRYTGSTKLDKEVVDVMREFGIDVMATTIGQRVAYREAPTNGLGVVEFKDPKAKEEMQRFTAEVEAAISAFIQQ